MKWYEDPVYIKMCEKSVEIQGQAPEHIDVKGLTDYISLDIYGQRWAIGKNKFPIWLPRQDQLQEMVGCNENTQIVHHRLYQVVEFMVGRDLGSMEQLWLAFVMSELYQKKWDGEDWVWD